MEVLIEYQNCYTCEHFTNRCCALDPNRHVLINYPSIGCWHDYKKKIKKETFKLKDRLYVFTTPGMKIRKVRWGEHSFVTLENGHMQRYSFIAGGWAKMSQYLFSRASIIEDDWEPYEGLPRMIGEVCIDCSKPLSDIELQHLGKTLVEKCEQKPTTPIWSEI